MAIHRVRVIGRRNQIPIQRVSRHGRGWLILDQEDLVDRNTLLERDPLSRYRRAEDLDGSSGRESERLATGPALITIIAASLGLWWVLWWAVSLLASHV